MFYLGLELSALPIAALVAFETIMILPFDYVADPMPATEYIMAYRRVHCKRWMHNLLVVLTLGLPTSERDEENTIYWSF